MRSIRLSLVVYFLILLALGLGAVSVFAYRTTQDTLVAMVVARRHLLRTKNDDRCQELNSKFDRDLLTRAQYLATRASFLFTQTQLRHPEAHVLGLFLAEASAPNRSLLPVWSFEGANWRRFVETIRFMHVTEIQLVEDNQQPTESQVTYVQINSRNGLSEWRSASMGGDRFPFDPEQFAALPPFEWTHDNTELAGKPLRRVSFKTPIAQAQRMFFWRSPPYQRPPGMSGPGGERSRRPNREPPAQPPRPPPTPRPQQTPTIFIQCAVDSSQHAAQLAQLHAGLDDELAALQVESEGTLAGLRTRLWSLGLATFAATVLGGLWLVRAGLSPLQRLSHAVSQVSEKDFRLPIDERHLPRELLPIVERLTQTLDQLKRAFAREKQAAADISHELRTPLAALLTTIEVTLRKPRPPEEYREVLADCLAAGQQISQLVERLLALARLDAGVDKVRVREVDVAALADQCAALVRPLAEARQLSLSVQRNGPTSLVADPDKLREVLTNLLHNAIEYNRPHGTVEVAVERQNGYVQLEVRDTGIGIAAEAREHIFERFFRADPSRHAEGQHAGLGLAIVKGYIDLMGGTITVDSTQGQGSTFRVRLPVS